jgi:hypothetical protein
MPDVDEAGHSRGLRSPSSCDPGVSQLARAQRLSMNDDFVRAKALSISSRLSRLTRPDWLYFQIDVYTVDSGFENVELASSLDDRNLL